MSQSDPNRRQVGGDHYRSDYQHWDMVLDTGMGYLEGCATKYASRWRKKGDPLGDLEKARHYTEKLHHTLVNSSEQRTRAEEHVQGCITRFVKANDLQPLEELVVLSLALWETPAHVEVAMHAIDQMITTHQALVKLNGLMEHIFDGRGAEGVLKGRTEHPAPFGYEPEPTDTDEEES